MLTSMGFVFHEYSSDSGIHPCGAQVGQAFWWCTSEIWSYIHSGIQQTSAAPSSMCATGLIPVQTVTSWRCASLSSSHPEYLNSQSSPVHCDGAEFRDGVECAARFVAVYSMGHGANAGLGAGMGETKLRPRSVALCAAIGESSKDDCTTDGHLQATMIPFVQTMSSPLKIKLVIL